VRCSSEVVTYINAYYCLVVVFYGDRRTLTVSVQWRSAVDLATETQLCRSSFRSEGRVVHEALPDREDSVVKMENQDCRENQVEIMHI